MANELTESQSAGYFILVDVCNLTHTQALRKVRKWGKDAEEEAWAHYHESGASMEQAYS